jgi:hypothetical protein
MRYGRPRRNHDLSDMTLASLIKSTEKKQQVEEEEEEEEEEDSCEDVTWKWVNASGAIICLAFFTCVFVCLFLIFHNVDNKPFWSIFGLYGGDSNNLTIGTNTNNDYG